MKTILSENRVYQTETPKELFDDCKNRTRRFVLSKDMSGNGDDMPAAYRYYADGVQFDNGTIVLYHTGSMRTSRVEVFPSFKDMMIASYAHEYEVHWLDPEVSEGDTNR